MGIFVRGIELKICIPTASGVLPLRSKSARHYSVGLLFFPQGNKVFCSYADRSIFYVVVLTPADEEHHVDKSKFRIPFVCGARNLGEALRRISEGAAMIRTKGEAGTGNQIHEMLIYKLFLFLLKNLLKVQDKN